LAKALTSPEVARFIRERYQGAVVPSGGAAEQAPRPDPRTARDRNVSSPGEDSPGLLLRAA
jgi:hypothetical protein